MIKLKDLKDVKLSASYGVLIDCCGEKIYDSNENNLEEICSKYSNYIVTEIFECQEYLKIIIEEN